ncbi:hypothetical protein ABZ953_06790 [Streptomyces sp. NPDC046465]|uniref:hypothetical protein n=1 Tax=Streptomyces sp. NPDC046465 TaxID=3155810 RepID=UPI0033EDBBDB
MDIGEMLTRDGMRDFTSDQRDTYVNDATEIRQLGLIFKARIGQTRIDGDKPWSAKRRAHKVGRRVDEVARLLERAAAKVEALDATYGSEVLDLPERRAKALARKQQRRDARELTRRKAQALTGRTLAESAAGLAADPRTEKNQAAPPMPQSPPPVYVHPHGFQQPPTGAFGEPLEDITSYFANDFPEAR